MASRKPKIIVFDLDYTLWPFWVDTHVDPPFKKDSNGKIIDNHGQQIKCYSEVPEVLKRLKESGFILGVASRTGEIRGANQLLDLWNWRQYFSYIEIYPGCKVQHFSEIRKNSGIEFRDMLFFDDENRNIRDLTHEGVVSILVEHGVTWRVIEEGLKRYANERK